MLTHVTAQLLHAKTWPLFVGHLHWPQGFSVTDVSIAEREASVLVNTTGGQRGGDVYYGVYGVWERRERTGVDGT